MRISLGIASGLAASLLALASPFAVADELKIGYVSSERIMRESGAAKAAEGRLKEEFAKRDNEIKELGARLKATADKIEKDGPVTPEADRARQQRELRDLDLEFQSRRRAYQEDLQQRQNEEVRTLFERAQRIVRQVAEQEKYDLILNDAVYAGPRVDITEKVLKTLDGMK
jgi:outer membrane protein